MISVGRFVQRFIPRTFDATKNIFLGQTSLGCNFAPASSISRALVNSIQKSWYSSLFARCHEPRSLLSLPPPVSSMQVAGFKVKYALKRRCKDCYFVVRQERRYVMCPTHPRHKQMAPIKKPRYTWILTHASYSKVRPW
uniref:Ribosomal protein n=1 Tax=Lygus hesperus TaxID=30085 RepID=A0A0A9XKQ8_LYGHE